MPAKVFADSALTIAVDSNGLGGVVLYAGQTMISHVKSIKIVLDAGDGGLDSTNVEIELARSESPDTSEMIERSRMSLASLPWIRVR